MLRSRRLSTFVPISLARTLSGCGWTVLIFSRAPTTFLSRPGSVSYASNNECDKPIAVETTDWRLVKSTGTLRDVRLEKGVSLEHFE